jgi:hypothetical protein
MQCKLVSPQRTLHFVACKDEVGSLVDQLGLDKKKAKALKGNLNQLCGYNEVGSSRGKEKDDRFERKETENWQLLGGIRWLFKSDTRSLVPLVGKCSHMYKTIVEQHTDILCQNERKLSNLCNGTVKKLDGGWTLMHRGFIPSPAMQLSDGASLLSVTMLPDEPVNWCCFS